jgi:hypothetical protein
MKNLFACIFLLYTVSAFSQQRSPISPTIKKLKNDTIVWRADSLLRQEDFKAKPQKGGPLGLSAIGIFLYPGETSGELLFYVEALFMKSKSYLVKYSDYVLKHEQTHFDIAEVFARTLRKKIAETDFKKIKNTGNEMNKLYEKTMKDYFKEQATYDKDTEHGVNPAKQKLWNEDISQRLKDLDNYSPVSVHVTN